MLRAVKQQLLSADDAHSSHVVSRGSVQTEPKSSFRSRFTGVCVTEVTETPLAAFALRKSVREMFGDALHRALDRIFTSVSHWGPLTGVTEGSAEEPMNTSQYISQSDSQRWNIWTGDVAEISLTWTQYVLIIIYMPQTHGTARCLTTLLLVLMFFGHKTK